MISTINKGTNMRKTSEVIINGISLDKIISKHLKWLENKGGCRADLSNLDLSDVDLSGSNFQGAIFSGSNLSGSNLQGSNLQGSNLSMANLYLANLQGSNLSMANLCLANLSGTNLSEADLNGTNLDDTFYQVSRIGSHNRMTTYNATKDIVWCGYFKGTMKEFKENVESTHKNNPRYLAQYRAVIDYFNSLASIKNGINNQQRN
jgi:uncharacterized protein YjbI with pentapeptide repeats